MTIRLSHILPALILGLLMHGNLQASLIEGDSLTITVEPANGTLDGAPGSTVGWGFTADWSSTDGDWISFTGSSIGSIAAGGNESNPGVLDAYTDYIGAQGGPNDFAIGPSDGPWNQAFDGFSLGLGAYRITGDPGFTGAEDHGQITIYYDVTDRDPTLPGAVDLGTGSYFGTSTAFSVTVDAAAPEPTSLWLLLSGTTGFFLIAWRRRRHPASVAWPASRTSSRHSRSCVVAL